MADELISTDYVVWLEAVKARIQSARSRAALAVNAELIQLYHSIGSDILDRKTRLGWGSKVIARAATDLKSAFPDMKGFSTSNLKYMRYFAENCPTGKFGQQPADQLPWFHIVTLLTQAELSAGFAFVGRQFRFEVGGHEFFIDLLFYHTRLKCYVVIELKGCAFMPEHVGQLNFYLSAVDSQIKADDDKPTIGPLLCQSQNRIVAEYALRDTTKPMGIAEYQLMQSLPEPLQTNLPSIEEIEAELAGESMDDLDAEGTQS